MLAIVQLSDIHFRLNRSNPISARAAAVAAAIGSVTRDAQQLVIVVSGDIAFAGLADEYVIAKSFFNDLRQQLAEVQKVASTTWIALPGNHDCDHTIKNQLRPAAISRALSGGAPDASTLELALGVQAHFSAFNEELFKAGVSVGSLARVVRVPVGSKEVQFNILNAAWCSVNPEVYGQLWIPDDAIRAISTSAADLTVTVLHYPLNWFDGTTRKQLRKAIDTSSQLVLTGHEHDRDIRHISPAEGFACEHVAAGQLQDEHEPETSQFSVFLLNPETMESSQHSFVWDRGGKSYRAATAVRRVSLLKRRFGAAGTTLEHTPTFEDFLDDLGAPISHPNPNARHLADFFIWPDATVWKGRTTGARQLISTSEVLGRRKQFTLLAGTERAGKTSLGKWLVREWHSKNRHALWVHVPTVERALGKSLDAALEMAVQEQYGHGAETLFSQLPPTDKTVVVDDFHLLANEVDREALLKALSFRFDSVILLVSEDWIAEQTASSDRFPELFSYQLLRLQPFGPSLRHQLVSKWVRLTPSLRNDVAVADRKIEQMSGLLDGLIGHDLVAPFPSTLLIMLQTLSAQGSIEVNHGSLGHTYHTLIHARISDRVSVAQTNMRLRFLTEIAWALFSGNGEGWPDERVKAWHREYADRFDLGHEADDLLVQLLRCGMLEHRGGMWHFRHKYVYFYFVAEHIHQYLHEPGIVDVLRGLVLRLHNEDATNIFAFVAFKSRNDVVLSLLLDRASALFQTSPECDIAKDCPHLDTLARDVPRLVYAQEERERVRSSMLAERDGQERSNPGSYSARDVCPAPSPPDEDFLQKFITSIRLVTVLGQVVRNHAGQLEADKMQELVRCTYSLSARTLSAFLETADKEREALVKDVVSALKEKDKNISIGELQVQVSSRLVFLIELAALGLLRHAGNSVGMGELLGRTLQGVAHASSNASIEMIDTSIELDRSKVYPRERVISLAKRLSPSPFALGVLRLMCLTNFYVFRVPEPDRQAVCSAIGIDDAHVSKLQLFSSRAKLPMTKVPESKRFKPRPKKTAKDRAAKAKKKRR